MHLSTDSPPDPSSTAIPPTRVNLRPYARNSPEAAARIVALVLIADGQVTRAELQALDHLRIEPALGLPAGGFGPLVHALCEDLLLDAYSAGSHLNQVDPATLAAILAEVDQPALRRTVLALAEATAVADGHLAGGEALVMAAALAEWGPLTDLDA